MNFLVNFRKIDRIPLKACLNCCSSFEWPNNQRKIIRAQQQNVRTFSSLNFLTVKPSTSYLLTRSTLLNDFSRRYKSLSVEFNAENATQNFTDSDLGPIPEPPEVMPIEEYEAVQAALRDTLAYHDLDTWWPAGLVRQLLDVLHSSTGLPWWEVIMISALIIRLATSPLIVMNMKHIARMSPHLEEQKRLQKAVSDAARAGDQIQMQLAMIDFQEFHKKHKIELWRPLVRIIPNAMVFASYFFALKKMANAPIESFKTGGLLWFPDLTVGDPYWFALPAVCAITMHFVIKLGIESGMSTDAMAEKMKIFMQYGVPVGIVLFSSYFPTALLVYWCTANFAGLFISLALRMNFLKKALRIPEFAARPKPAPKPKDAIVIYKNPILYTKNLWKRAKRWNEDRKSGNITEAFIDKTDRERFSKSGKVQPQPTYPFNPVERSPHLFRRKEQFWDKLKFWKRKAKKN